MTASRDLLGACRPLPYHLRPAKHAKGGRRRSRIVIVVRPTRFLAACATSLLGLPVWAEPCTREARPLAAGLAREVEYAARVHAPGYRFALEGLSWELVRTQLTDPRGEQRFAITYPVVLDAEGSPAGRDFFVSLEAREASGDACSDVKFLGDSPVHRLPVSDDSDAVIRFGDLDRKAKLLESTRTLATELRVRAGGAEVIIATGFATRRSLNISGCASGFDDSYGYVEYQPGQVQVSCFPADPEARDYLDEIDWRVDYDWPSNPPALIDALIDYVYVETLRDPD